MDVWVSVCVYGTFFRLALGILYLLGNRKTWLLTVKPHLTSPLALPLFSLRIRAVEHTLHVPTSNHWEPARRLVFVE